MELRYYRPITYQYSPSYLRKIFLQRLNRTGQPLVSHRANSSRGALNIQSFKTREYLFSTVSGHTSCLLLTMIWWFTFKLNHLKNYLNSTFCLITSQISVLGRVLFHSGLTMDLRNESREPTIYANETCVCKCDMFSESKKVQAL